MTINITPKFFSWKAPASIQIQTPIIFYLDKGNCLLASPCAPLPSIIQRALVFLKCTSDHAIPLLKIFPWLSTTLQIQIPHPGLQGLRLASPPPPLPHSKHTGYVLVLRHSKLCPPQGLCTCPFLCLECSSSLRL